MLNLTFKTDRPLHLLCLGAHCDDIEIGAGGTLLRLLAERRVGRVDWVVFSSTDLRAPEARAGQYPALEELYRLFSYFNRWHAQLQERLTQLSQFPLP